MVSRIYLFPYDIIKEIERMSSQHLHLLIDHFLFPSSLCPYPCALVLTDKAYFALFHPLNFFPKGLHCLYDSASIHSEYSVELMTFSYLVIFLFLNIYILFQFYILSVLSFSTGFTGNSRNTKQYRTKN